RLLNLRRGSAQCPDRAGVGHLDVPAGVDILGGQRDEIAGPDTGFDRNKQAARGGLEERDADAVANAERDLSRGTPVGENGADPERVACKGIDDLRRDLDQGIRQACWVVGIPAAVNFTNLMEHLFACLIVAPQRGYDAPAILSYAISSFCPTSADGLQRQQN